jgi:hypothetical protein
MLRPIYRMCWHLMPIVVTSIVISGALVVANVQSSPMSAYAASGGSASCNLIVRNPPSALQDFVQRFRIAFKTFCPELEKRFAITPDAVKNVVLSFKDQPYPAATSGHHITADPTWLEQNPKQAVGAILHESEHVMQFTSPEWFKATPSWFTEGLADYVRSVYGPKDDDWSMPPVKPTDSYTEAYRVTARFLHWLEQHTVPGIVDQLSRAMLAGQSFSATFQRLAGDTVDALWSQYEADSALKPFQCIPSPDQLTTPGPVTLPNKVPAPSTIKTQVS